MLSEKEKAIVRLERANVKIAEVHSKRTTLWTEGSTLMVLLLLFGLLFLEAFPDTFLKRIHVLMLITFLAVAAEVAILLVDHNMAKDRKVLQHEFDRLYSELTE